MNEGEECEGGEGVERRGGGGGLEGRTEGVGDFGKNWRLVHLVETPSAASSGLVETPSAASSCRLHLVYGRQDEEIAAPLRARLRV